MSASFKNYFRYFLILVYVSGAIGFALKPSFFIPFTPLTLLLTCFVFLLYQPITNTKYVLSFLGVGLIGFGSEWLGIKTGLIFGDYIYGEALGYKLYGVPITISLNWALLINASVLVCARYFSQPVLLSLASSCLITALDFIIEQSASQLNFWHFSSGLAGWHNYLGWLCVSFLASFLFAPILKKGNYKIATLVLLLQLFFFSSVLVLNFINL